MLPLHSLVPPAEQRRVFVRPPPGVRKIVLATNIAETAITIDDVTAIINSGRLKEKSYDPYTSVGTLQVSHCQGAIQKYSRTHQLSAQVKADRLDCLAAHSGFISIQQIPVCFTAYQR